MGSGSPRRSAAAGRSGVGLPGIALVVALVLTACGGDGTGESTPNDAPGFPARSAEAGSVEVRVVPRRLAEGTAAFDITLDTHTGDLDVNLSNAASLTIGGDDWRSVGFRGDGPGGHHREGTLRFRGIGPTVGEMRLIIGGLDRPLAFRWIAEEESR